VAPGPARRVHTAAPGVLVDRGPGIAGLAGRTALFVSAGAGSLAVAALVRQ